MIEPILPAHFFVNLYILDSVKKNYTDVKKSYTDKMLTARLAFCWATAVVLP
jgi:hypothetical protein